MAVAEEVGASFDTVLYMKVRLGRDELADLVRKLEDPVEDLVRKDSTFKKLELNPDDYVGEPEAVIDLLARHPGLLQRPVVVKGDRAIIGRPRDRIGDFLSG